MNIIKHYLNGQEYDCGDRTSDNIPEIPVAKELGVHLIWGVGGGKIQSSSDLVDGLVGTPVRMYKEKQPK